MVRSGHPDACERETLRNHASQSREPRLSRPQRRQARRDEASLPKRAGAADRARHRQRRNLFRLRPWSSCAQPASRRRIPAFATSGSRLPERARWTMRGGAARRRHSGADQVGPGRRHQELHRDRRPRRLHGLSLPRGGAVTGRFRAARHRPAQARASRHALRQPAALRDDSTSTSSASSCRTGSGISSCSCAAMSTITP